MIGSKKSCCYCGSEKFRYEKEIKGFPLYKCSSCNLLFTGVNDANHTQGKGNSEVYSKSYIANYLARAKSLKRRFTSRLREIEYIKSGGKLLDVGCGLGLFLETVNEYSRHDWELFGIDINDDLIKKSQARLPSVKLYWGNLSATSFPSNYFDCVTCFDVLEHDINLKKTLTEIKRVLKPNGLLVVQVPNNASLMAYLCGYEWDWWSVPDHIIHFTPRTLTSVMENEGYRLLKIFTWDPAKEFVSNIRGSLLKKKTSKNLLIRQLIKILILPLYSVWLIKKILEKKFNVGGLMVVFLNKS